MKAAVRTFTTIFSMLIVILAILLVGVRLIGLTPYTVLSSSMEPAYRVGSLIYVRDIPVESIEIGDAITFVMNDDLQIATHRVVDKDTSEQHFRTKGDANESIDGAPVHFNNVLGRVAFSIPYLGYVANYINSGQGRWVAITVVAILFLLLILPDLFTADKKKKKDQTEDNADPASGTNADQAVLHRK